MSSFIELKNISYVYSGASKQQVAAIHDVNLEINKGELVGVIGHTGSGKSTLISHFNGLLKPTTGQVYVDGIDIRSGKEVLRNAKFKVGICFQYPEYQLFEETVFKDIAFGPKNMGLSEDQIRSRVIRAASFCGVKSEHLDKSPFDLSGGEKRRVAIAGVMAMEPDILVLDEPAAGLDPKGRKNLMRIIKKYRDETGAGVVLVSHSMEEVSQFAERVIVLNDGTIAMDGSVTDVFSDYEKLKSMGLDIPDIRRLFDKLARMGFDVPSNVFDYDIAVELLKNLLKKEGQ